LKHTTLKLVLVFFLCIGKVSFAGDTITSTNSIDTIYLSKEVLITPQEKISNDSSTTLKEKRKKKFVAALTAFPFPMGFVGAHRVMLGTKPWVPVVYVATFGGVFGLLPLIDFCVILFAKDIEQYENNPNIFMWVK